MKKVPSNRQSHPVTLGLATIAAIGSVCLAVHQYRMTRRFARLPARPFQLLNSSAAQSSQPNFIKTPTGRHKLWAQGPRDLKTGEWFDVTGSPLEPEGYQHGIGKDAIPAIDKPKFVAIQDRIRLHEYGIEDGTLVLGYRHNGEAKAYPLAIMNRHELVNDVVGGKPVTVGW